ncbi:MAG: CPBP family intramembrane metalloprotease [bacterium]|nr:CPBP family intramembrane metalloprotease [bacterium]MCM1375610.1 CPBP family intramembrane metalloprotease [Muribaculum sp.]
MAKRMGWIGLCILALVAALFVQIIASVMVVLPYMIAEGLKTGMQTTTQGVNVDELSANMMSNMGEITGIILVVVGVLLLFVFVPWFYFGCGRRRITGESAKRVFSPRALLVTVVLAIGLNYGINCIMQLIYLSAPQLLNDYMQMMEDSGLGVNGWANAAAVILAPLGEELIFRGVVFSYARRAVAGMRSPRAAFWIANSIQALLFGAYHMNVVQGLYAFFIGLALGYLCQRYDSLIPGMLAHLVFNGMSTLLGEGIYTWIPEEIFWYALVSIVAVAIVVAAIALNGPVVPKDEQNVA